MTHSAETASHSPSGERDDTPAAATPRRRVLVVDDHRDAARMLGILIDTLGHEVRTAHNGLQALDDIVAFRPEVVFLDIGLPEIDGYEVARRLRAKPEGRAATLIALTGWSHDEDRRRALEAGFDHHVAKPVSAKQLRELLAAPPRA